MPAPLIIALIEPITNIVSLAIGFGLNSLARYLRHRHKRHIQEDIELKQFNIP